MKYLAYLICVLSHIALTSANCEKVVFYAPPSIDILSKHPKLKHLKLEALTPSNTALRKNIDVEFPTKIKPRGAESWYLLDNLQPGQRYECRLCWAAIQPTRFWVREHLASEVLNRSRVDLIGSLTNYSIARTARLKDIDSTQIPIVTDQDLSHPTNRSFVFLQVTAAADFYTTKKELMNDPPPVYVDIILDPFIINNFIPTTLVPTVCYITLLTIGSWFLSGIIWRRLRNLVSDKPKSHKA